MTYNVKDLRILLLWPGIFSNKKFGISLHAYIKSLKTRINTRFFAILSLHKAYIKPTRAYMQPTRKVAFRHPKSNFLRHKKLLLALREDTFRNGCND